MLSMKQIQLLQRNNFLKLLVIVVDLLLINFSYVLGFYIRFWGAPPAVNFTSYLQIIPFITLSSFIYIDLFGLLKFFRRSRRSVISSVIKLVCMQALTTTSLAYFLQQYPFPRAVLLLTPVLQIILLTAWNWLMLGLRDRYTDMAEAMLIGERHETDEVVERFNHNALKKKMTMKYVFAPEDYPTILKCLPKTDEVLLCSNLSEDLKMKIMMACMNQQKIVYLVPEVFEISLTHTRIIHLDDMPMLMLDRLSLSFEQRFFKRCFDLIATCIGIPILLPLFAVIAVLIKCSSPGSVFYRQDRVTTGGKIYRIYKFRTMVENAEAESGPILSGKGDERVTKIGRFLRRYRLDELPQLFNVLIGDMSLVGPRSERPFFVEQFNRDIDGYELRNSVKSGLTGYAQIFGNYDTSAEYKLKYDILYIKNYSLLLDIKLILQTFHAILKKGSE